MAESNPSNVTISGMTKALAFVLLCIGVGTAGFLGGRNLAVPGRGASPSTPRPILRRVFEPVTAIRYQAMDGETIRTVTLEPGDVRFRGVLSLIDQCPIFESDAKTVAVSRFKPVLAPGVTLLQQVSELGPTVIVAVKDPYFVCVKRSDGQEENYVSGINLREALRMLEAPAHDSERVDLESP